MQNHQKTISDYEICSWLPPSLDGWKGYTQEQYFFNTDDANVYIIFAIVLNVRGLGYIGIRF